MGTPRPKEFFAATSFSIPGVGSYEAGDPITDPATLRSLLRFGDTFATTATRHADSTTEPTEGEVNEPKSEED